MKKKNKQIAPALLAWFDQHGRRDLPWQINKTPYRVWVSEIMLQQTQVNTVVPAFERFMQRFPDIAALAAASMDEVLHVWSGLGYYSRARNLHRTACMIMQDFEGNFPEDLPTLQTFPGIGRSTAGAILSIACGKKAAILDGNVKRVLTRLYGITAWPGEKETQKTLWALAEQLTPGKRTADYTQAIMDLGATVCTRSQPHCSACPLVRHCCAYKEGMTAHIPRPRPAKKMPVRSTGFLVLQQTQAILLEKRPSAGIWGGLWSFPEVSADANIESIRAFCQQTLGLSAIRMKKLDIFRHTFTHFHLDIQPILVSTCANKIIKAEQTQNRIRIWYNAAKSPQIGLPAPVKKILDMLLCHASFIAAN